ncbi:MAG: family 78 glycoside hydrolase catalytic domain [Bacteroidales bacterium]|nr:family 78 glycoside hydrolase catalytic domain [Bacteroidales bacterium]
MRKLFLILALAVPAILNAGPSGCPTGLMTDLVEHTGQVWSDGCLTDLNLADLSKAKGSFQTVEIRSLRPSFSWIVPGSYPARQVARQIVLCESPSGEVIWDSGWVGDDRSTAVPYGGKALEPNKIYSWKVRVKTDADGESGWSEAKFFKTAAELCEYSTPSYPLVKEEQAPVSQSSLPSRAVLYDFGRDAFGQLRLTVSSRSGEDTVMIHLGERIQDGRVLRKPTTTVRYQLHKIALKKGTHTYRVVIPPDRRNTGPAAVKMPEYIGEVLPFRYCEVEPSEGEVKSIIREAVHYPFDMDAASFSSSDNVLNQVWDLCRYSVKATSFTGLFVDGDRERIPYEADALISQLCHYAADREFTLSRRTIEYLLDYPTWPTEWILQAVLMAWNDYLFTGDKRLLEQQYGILRAHCMETLIQANGLMSTTLVSQGGPFLESIRRKEKIRDIVDWPHSGSLGLAPGYGGEDDGFEYTDYNAVVNAYAFRALTLMSRIASELGESAEAEELSAKAARMETAFRKNFFDRKKGYFVDGIGVKHSSLHTNMFALLFGLVPEKSKAKVMKFIISRGMACSVYGAQFLLEALYDGGAGQEALDLMTDDSLRSWYNMVRCGSTITLEAWDDSFKPNQDWNHLWGAAPGNIIPFKMMGVEPLEPGFSKVRIRPQPGSLEHAQMSLPTIRGTIRMIIENTPQRRSVSLELPANMEAEIVLPDGFELDS